MKQVKDIEKFNLTHSKTTDTFALILAALRQKILDRGDLPHISAAYQLEIVEQLSNFPLGRFILERNGANGFWTDYMIAHPSQGRITGLNIEGKPFSPLEDFFLNRCPIVVAHQERFKIFQQLIQNELKENMVLASIPCGLMRDLITLDYSHISTFKLIGIDIDEESLLLAKVMARENKIKNIQFEQQDAWQISFDNELDLITSSGLNVYEPDHNKVIDLYSKFFSALKPGGSLIISILTYPPGEKGESDWDISELSPQDLLMEHILHKDILDIKWRNFRSSDELCYPFEDIGFSKVSVHFDKHHIFPTLHAKKAK